MKKVSILVLALLLVCSLSSTGLAYTDIMTPGGELPIVTSDYHLVIGTPAVATVTDYENNHLTQYLRERSGVDIEVYLFDAQEYRQQLQLMTSAGEKLPDTIWAFNLTAVERESYGRQGYFIPLNDFFADGDLAHFFWDGMKYVPEQKQELTIKTGLSSDGNLYAFPFWLETVADAWSFGLLINNTFLDALDMEIPTTTEELHEYLLAVKEKDPNGNGIADEIPLVGHTSWTGDVINILMNSFTYYPNVDSASQLCSDDEGNLYLPYATEEYRDGLRFIHQLYEEGLISDLSFSQDRYGLQAMTDLTGDQPDVVGAAVSHRSFMFASHATAERRTHYTTLGVIEGPDGVAFTPTHAVEPRYTSYITCDAADPEIAFRLLDMCCDPEATFTIRYGREGEYWRWANEEDKAAGAYYSALGYTDVLYTSNDMKLAWGQQTDEIWNTNAFTWQPIGLTALTPGTVYENPISQYNADDWRDGIVARYGKCPKILVGSLAYTEDEINQLGTVQADLNTYVNECATRFVIGEMNLDTDWDTFQSTLEAMGMSNYLATAQAAYDRAFK